MTPQEELVREVARGMLDARYSSIWLKSGQDRYDNMAKAAIAIVVERQSRELALSELANIEGASADWLEGFRFAANRVRALAEKGEVTMYAPDVWETTEAEKAYAELRKRADELGFACVGEALDKLEEMLEPR